MGSGGAQRRGHADDRGVTRPPDAGLPESGVDRGAPSAAYGGSAAADNELAGSLSELARHLQDASSTDEVLAEIVTAAIELIPGTEEGSVADVQDRGHRIVHRAASSDLPKRVDALMQEVAQGPCLDAVWQQRTVRVDDLAEETRWPSFSRRAVELGARSMLSFQLYVENRNLGALNLYSGRPGAFTDDSDNIGLLLASHAAIAFAGAQNSANLHIALDSRAAIGQATGILMERYRLGMDRAFGVLVRFSQQSNRKLADVASQIVHDTHAGHRVLPAGSAGTGASDEDAHVPSPLGVDANDTEI